MKDKLIGAVQVIFVLVIAGFYLKGCFVSVTDFEEPIYAHRSLEDGQEDYIWILPSEELISYKKVGNSEDAALLAVRGEKLSSIVGPIYNTGNTPLGLRIYPGANDVHKVELQLVESDFIHCERSSFGEIGDSYDEVFVFYDKSISVPDDFAIIDPSEGVRQRLEYWYKRLKNK